MNNSVDAISGCFGYVVSIMMIKKIMTMRISVTFVVIWVCIDPGSWYTVPCTYIGYGRVGRAWIGREKTNVFVLVFLKKMNRLNDNSMRNTVVGAIKLLE
jgi:hypothetical protein